MSDERTCPSCGRENSRGAGFCFGCGVALDLGPLAGLDARDRQRALDGLLTTLSAARAGLGGDAASDPAARELLHAHLSAFWLRPETALVQTLQARALIPLLGRGPGGPILDVGCGDGIHTSLVHGWRFDPAFDAYAELDLAATDAFDAAPVATRPPRVERRGTPIDAGVDIKDSMAARTRLLGSFVDVRQADASALPFPDGSFARLHSNAIVHLDERVLEPILAECVRVLRPGGALVLVSIAENYGECLHFARRARDAAAAGDEHAAAAFGRLDRGRSSGLIRSHTSQDWARRARAAGLSVDAEVRCVPPALLSVWDTGLRPFAPQLVQWAESVRGSDGFPAVKAGAIAALEALLGPLVDGPVETPTGTTRVLRLVKG